MSQPEQHNPAVQNLHLFTPQPVKQDICLVAACRSILIDNGAAARICNYDNDSYVRQATNLPWEGQRHLLNRYWNSQLMVNPNQSMEERYCLLDISTADAWLRIFREKIIPFCIRHSLPASTSELYSGVGPH